MCARSSDRSNWTHARFIAQGVVISGAQQIDFHIARAAQCSARVTMARSSSDVADIDQYQWERLPDMSNALCYTTGAYHQGKLYVLGKWVGGWGCWWDAASGGGLLEMSLWA